MAVVAAAALTIFASMEGTVHLQTLMDGLRAVAIAAGCPAERVRVSSRVTFPTVEVEVTCAPAK